MLQPLEDLPDGVIGFEAVGQVRATDYWVKHAASLVGWMMPGEFRRFALAELPDAITWAACGDQTT